MPFRLLLIIQNEFPAIGLLLTIAPIDNLITLDEYKGEKIINLKGDWPYEIYQTSTSQP